MADEQGLISKFSEEVQDLFDTAVNAFKGLGEFKINEYIARQLADVRQAEAEADILREQRLQGLSQAPLAAAPNLLSGMTAQQQQMLALGFAGVGLYLLMRR